MTLQTHDEIKRVAHAIISEYVRAYPAMPHTEVLGDFVDRLELSVHKLRNAEMRARGQALQHEEPQQAGAEPALDAAEVAAIEKYLNDSMK